MVTNDRLKRAHSETLEEVCYEWVFYTNEK